MLDAQPADATVESIGSSVRTGQPADPVHCLLLGQLATDLASVRKVIGTGLLKHTLALSDNFMSLRLDERVKNL